MNIYKALNTSHNYIAFYCSIQTQQQKPSNDMAVYAAQSLRDFLEYMLVHGPEDYNEHRPLQSRVVDYVQRICSLYPEMRLVLREVVTVNG